MDHMDASCVFYVKVHTFGQLEQSKINVLTIIAFGIVMLTVCHNMIVRMYFVLDPGNVLRQTSPDILPVEEFAFYIYQTWDISCRSLQCIPANKETNQTNVLQIAEPLKSPATCSYTQPDKTWVDCASRLSFIPLWLEAYYIFLSTLHFSLSSSSPFPQQQVMAPQTPQISEIKSQSSWTMGTSSNAPLAETQQQHRHQFVHRHSAIAATNNMAYDPHLKIVHETGRCNDRKQLAIGCEYFHIDVEGGQLTM